MLPCRAVVTAGAVGGGAAPDALVAAGAVAVLLRGRMVAARAVARRPAVFAMLLVVAMLVFAGRAVVTAASVAHTSAVSAFRAHDAFLSTARSIPQFRWVWQENERGACRWAHLRNSPYFIPLESTIQLRWLPKMAPLPLRLCFALNNLANYAIFLVM